MIRDPITPTPKEVEAWRTMAETVRNFGGVTLGEFDWPWVVLSLIQGLDRERAHPLDVLAADTNEVRARAYQAAFGEPMPDTLRDGSQ